MNREDDFCHSVNNKGNDVIYGSYGVLLRGGVWPGITARGRMDRSARGASRGVNNDRRGRRGASSRIDSYCGRARDSSSESYGNSSHSGDNRPGQVSGNNGGNDGGYGSQGLSGRGGGRGRMDRCARGGSFGVGNGRGGGRRVSSGSYETGGDRGASSGIDGGRGRARDSSSESYGNSSHSGDNRPGRVSGNNGGNDGGYGNQGVSGREGGRGRMHQCARGGSFGVGNGRGGGRRVSSYETGGDRGASSGVDGGRGRARDSSSESYGSSSHSDNNCPGQVSGNDEDYGCQTVSVRRGGHGASSGIDGYRGGARDASFGNYIRDGVRVANSGSYDGPKEARGEISKSFGNNGGRGGCSGSYGRGGARVIRSSIGYGSVGGRGASSGSYRDQFGARGGNSSYQKGSNGDHLGDSFDYGRQDDRRESRNFTQRRSPSARRCRPGSISPSSRGQKTNRSPSPIAARQAEDQETKQAIALEIAAEVFKKMKDRSVQTLRLKRVLQLFRQKKTVDLLRESSFYDSKLESFGKALASHAKEEDGVSYSANVNEIIMQILAEKWNALKCLFAIQFFLEKCDAFQWSWLQSRGGQQPFRGVGPSLQQISNEPKTLDEMDQNVPVEKFTPKMLAKVLEKMKDAAIEELTADKPGASKKPADLKKSTGASTSYKKTRF